MDREIADDRPDPVVWGCFAQVPALSFLLPLMVYMVLLSFLPGPPDAGAPAGEGGAETENWFGMTYAQFPYAYAAALLGGVLTLAACWRPIRGQFPPRVTWLAPVVGLIGVVLWVAICWIDFEGRLVAAMGQENPLVKLLGMGPRPAYNPFEQLAGRPPALLWGFLAVRLFGLAVFVPIAEELMLRGWLLRHLETDGYHPNFWQVAFGQASATTIVVATAFPMLYHPEKLASLVWFSLVTWLMIRTKNFWDCVVAHAVTNLLLGVWVLTTGDWKLW